MIYPIFLKFSSNKYKIKKQNLRTSQILLNMFKHYRYDSRKFYRSYLRYIPYFPKSSRR